MNGDGGCGYGWQQPTAGLTVWLGLRVGGHLALSLHSSNEPGELLQWPRYDDSTINIVISISIIIIIISRVLNVCGANSQCQIEEADC